MLAQEDFAAISRRHYGCVRSCCFLRGRPLRTVTLLAAHRKTLSVRWYLANSGELRTASNCSFRVRPASKDLNFFSRSVKPAPGQGIGSDRTGGLKRRIVGLTHRIVVWIKAPWLSDFRCEKFDWTAIWFAKWPEEISLPFPALNRSLETRSCGRIR